MKLVKQFYVSPDHLEKCSCEILTLDHRYINYIQLIMNYTLYNINNWDNLWRTDILIMSVNTCHIFQQLYAYPLYICIIKLHSALPITSSIHDLTSESNDSDLLSYIEVMFNKIYIYDNHELTEYLLRLALHIP